MTRKIECKKSKHHGFHDADKPCSLCPDEEVTKHIPTYDPSQWQWAWQAGELVCKRSCD